MNENKLVAAVILIIFITILVGMTLIYNYNMAELRYTHPQQIEQR